MDYYNTSFHCVQEKKKLGRCHRGMEGLPGKVLCRWAALAGLLFFFAAALVLSVQPAEKAVEGYLGIPLLSESELAGLGSYQYRDYSENLKFQDEYAAIDQETSVIYIPQNIDDDTEAEALEGLLTIDAPGRKLFFAPDAYWESLNEAVRCGHPFKLIVSDWRNTYMQYDVVFTTLPVISMHGQLLYKDSEGRDVLSGRIVLWDPELLGAGESGVQASQLQWNLRGGSAASEPKKPWKLRLKNWNGKANSISLLQLGTDDHWILNSMCMEDSNIREKLFMDLWNEMAAQTDYNYPMSRGEYVEVLVNGEYFGLYLLQRRIDQDYLDLDDGDVIVKASTDTGNIVYEFFSNSGETISQRELDLFFEGMNCGKMVRDNFIDVSLFLQMFSSRDNMGYKNMFYVFEKQEDGYHIVLVPWDTDMTMGTVWVNDAVGFQYDYSKSLHSIVERRELKVMQQLYPDLNRDFQLRWKELRADIFHLESLTEKMTGYLEMLDSTGAPQRDQKKWGLFYEGEDTIEKLYRFVEERLLFVDGYYLE